MKRFSFPFVNRRATWCHLSWTLGVAILLSGCIAPPPKPDLAVGNRGFVPPKKEKFAWGASSSSYQYENPHVKPGTPADFVTDWDIMVSEGGAPEKGNAVYSWTEFRKDLAALKKLGVTHYRFSIEWARVEPKPGQFNRKAIAGYARMARELKNAGIEPVVCLWHFTFPSWLSDKKNPTLSNWLHPQVEERWKAYLHEIVPAVAPYTRFYAPQNEPNGQITTAYVGGMWPPRQTLHFTNYNKAIKVSARMFREAAAIVREHDSNAIVMSVEALPWWKRAPIDVTGGLYNFMQHNNFDHLDLIYDVCDIIGFNYYYSQDVSPISALTVGRHHGPNFTMMGWDIDPEGLYKQIKTVAARYGRPMMVTENGIATKNSDKAVRYISEHIGAIRRAQSEGYDVRGYFVWSLVDNYEWHYGYKATFGLSTMNPKNRDRELKPVGHYYRDVIKGKATTTELVTK